MKGEDGLTGFVRFQEVLPRHRRRSRPPVFGGRPSTAQYREGAVDDDVLDSQRSLLQEQNRLAETRAAIATSWIARTRP